MSQGVGRIVDAKSLARRLEEIERAGGDEAAFEELLIRLGEDLGVAIGCDSTLSVAQVGLRAFGPSAVRIRPQLAGFAGRPMSSLPGLRGRGAGLPAMPVGWTVESFADSLAADCAKAVPAEGNQAELIRVYTAMLARPDVREVVDLSRPVDLHVLLVVTAERASAALLSRVTFDEDVELAVFDWLHGLAHDSGDDDLAREVMARRELRLVLADVPAGEAVMQLCEVPVARLLPFEGPGDALSDHGLSRQQIAGSFEELAATRGVPSWAARLRGLSGASEADEPAELRRYAAAGRLVRWLLERDVEVGAMRMGRADEYAQCVTDFMEHDDCLNALHAHFDSVLAMAEDGIHLALAEELAFLAWLLDEADDFLDLGPMLKARSEALRGG